MDRHHRPAGCGILPLRGTSRNNCFRFRRPVVFRLCQYRHEKTPVGKDYLIPHLQLAANAGTPYIAPYQEMQTLSLTGRPWDAFDSALIRGDKLIGVLTDREKTPATIAARMLEYGYDNYRMTVGKH